MDAKGNYVSAYLQRPRRGLRDVLWERAGEGARDDGRVPESPARIGQAASAGSPHDRRIEPRDR